MTTPNPTPATREREAARELAHTILDSVGGGEWIDVAYTTAEKIIAAALARERREALTEAIEVVSKIEKQHRLWDSEHFYDHETCLAITQDIKKLIDNK